MAVGLLPRAASMDATVPDAIELTCGDLVGDLGDGGLLLLFPPLPLFPFSKREVAPGVDPFELNEELDPKESVGPMEEVKCCNSLGLVGGTAIAGVSLAFSPTF